MKMESDIKIQCETHGKTDACEMTAIAARLLNAIGAYRTPGDEIFTYMIITRAGWAQ